MIKNYIANFFPAFYYVFRMMRFTKGKAVKDMATNYNPTNLINRSLADLDYQNINLASEKERMSMTGQSGYSSSKPSRIKSLNSKN